MAKFNSDDPNRVRIIINGEEVDPNNLPPNLIGDKSKRAPKKGTGLGCAILSFLMVLLTVGSIGFGVLAGVSAIFGINFPILTTIMTALTGVEAEQTQPIKTDANNFDPFVGLAQAQELAGPDALLVEITAYYVRSDGTMDLYASYSPRVNYEFVRKIPRPEDAPPVGVAGSTNGQWYEPITVEVYKPGSHRSVSTISGGSRVSYSYVNEGMVRDKDSPTTSEPGEILPVPECTTQQLWEMALRKDAPRDAVASITYDADGYDFNITSVISLEFTSNCKLSD
jgi:hypothetical protein